MKKYLCVLSVFLCAVILMTGCNFYTNVTGSVQNSAQSTEKAEAMLTALAEGDRDAAVALMHPDVAENSNGAIEQMREYLNGKDQKEMTIQNVSVKNTTGTAGTARQESTVFRVVLMDETVIYISAVYLADNSGEGFVSFQIILGVI